MTRRYAHLIAVAMLVAATTVPIYAQQEPTPAAMAEWRAEAEQGDAGAQIVLGFMYKNDRGGVPQDDAEAVRWFRLAANQGDAAAHSRR